MGEYRPARAKEPMKVMRTMNRKKKESPIASISGTQMYDGGNMTVTVTTTEISHDEEDFTDEKTHTTMLGSLGDGVDRKHNLPVNKSKVFKEVAEQRSKPPSRRGGNKGKKKNKKMK